jgi:hypothetical protein
MKELIKAVALSVATLAVSPHCFALGDLELICSYKYEGVNIESQYIERDGRATSISAPVIRKVQSEGIERLIVQDNRNGYISIRNLRSGSVYSTKQSENRFLTWSPADVDMIVTRIDDGQKYIVIVDVVMRGYGRFNERVEIDVQNKLFNFHDKTIGKVTAGDARQSSDKKIIELSKDIITIGKGGGECK